MEILDELQDPMAQGVVAGDVGVANMASIAAGMAHHRHTPDSPMSHQEEDLSDPDRQDEESGEELPQQPLPSNNHSSTDNTPTPTPLSHLNSLMSSGPPLFLTKKIKLERQSDIELNKSGLEALQAAMSSSGFNIPFSFPNPGAFLNPAAQQHSAASLMVHSAGGNNGNGNAVISSASSHSSESSQGSGRNGLESVGGGGGGGGNAGPGAAIPAANSLSQSGAQGQQQTTAHQQQTSWSFEEQFKQVRQDSSLLENSFQPIQATDSWEDEDLNKSGSTNGKNNCFSDSSMSLLNKLYEINDDPKRKEFLDDLFSYMQKRGSPINRLPIMAKSVLDLYELYNLVIARGGLVDVINKKLWQEIIKGLHLPSSITSAAFTLRTQYMKYLYPYECEKKQLSTPAELQAAIDGNRREGRRSNYGAYGGGGGTTGGESLVHQRSPHSQNSLASLHGQINPISLVTAVQQVAAAGGQHQVPNPQNLVNGSAAHTPLPQHPYHPHLQASFGGTPNAGGIAPDFEARMAEYVKQWQREMGRRAATSPTNLINHRQGSDSPPPRSPSREAALFEMSKFTLWNMYNNNLHPGLGYPQAVSPQPSSHSPQGHPASPEPQKEALDLGLRSSPSSSSPARQSPISSAASMPIKRELEHNTSAGGAANKRLCIDEDTPTENNISALPGTHIKISNRGDGRDNSLVVSMELNGVMYQGVLFAQTDGRASLAASTNNNETKTSSRNVVS